MSLPTPLFAPRRCRRCHSVEPDVRFTSLARTLCVGCQSSALAARAFRRKGRPAAPPEPRPRRIARGSSSAHLGWIRTQHCAAGLHRCGSCMHAHHVRTGTDGGTGLKPSDRWAVPLCAYHHLELHNDGQRTFEARHGVDLRALACRYAAASPHLQAKEA